MLPVSKHTVQPSVNAAFLKWRTIKILLLRSPEINYFTAESNIRQDML